MKKLLMLLIICFGIMMSTCFAYEYVGNINSHIFHYTTCEWAAKMSYKNRVYYYSRQEYIFRGYRPCRVCNP